MKSSDQRYFQVRRTKREANLHPEIGLALTKARSDPSGVDHLNQLIEQSAHEFSHILLACGRTATDFRRNYRRGSASHNIVEANKIAPHSALQPAKLDGFVCLRLSKEQTWNVKGRFGKLRPQDVLIHDPQGTIWKGLVAASLAGSRDRHVELLADLRQRPKTLIDWEDATDVSHLLVKELERQLRGLAHREDEDFPQLGEIGARNLALRKYVKVKKLLTGEPDYISTFTSVDVRVALEKCLVCVEAYVDGGNVRAAYCDPDTSQRHCSAARLTARISRVEDRLLDMGDIDQRYYTPEGRSD